jgi:hypothetical protein
MIRSAAKQLIALIPAPFDIRALEFVRWAAHAETRRARARTDAILATLGRPTTVQGGPFRDLRYLPPGWASQGGYLPKLLGCYEAELADEIERAISSAPDVLVNIGAAEGYYAVGFASRSPTTRIVCFEMEKPYHTAIREFAQANRLEQQIEVLGTCDGASLQQSLSSATNALVLCDCEGAEEDLLDLEAAPALKRASIIVELHERYRPGISDRMRARFARTHDITIIGSRDRTRAEVPAAAGLSSDDFNFATYEGRDSVMEWLSMRPRKMGDN